VTGFVAALKGRVGIPALQSREPIAYLQVIATEHSVGDPPMTALNYITYTVVFMIVVMFSVLMSAPVSAAMF